MSMKSVNPTTGETLATFDTLGDNNIETALAAAEACYKDFSPRTRLNERLGFLSRAADILEQNMSRYARLMTLEMGKPIAQAEAEVAKCAAGCRHYVEHALVYLEDEHIATNLAESYIRWLPIGPVLAVMPWNFPFWQVFRFAAPALAAGNVGILKHASNVPQCALAIEDIFRQAGFPDGAFKTLLIGSDKVARVIADPRIRAATLTGSERAGSRVAEQAGAHLKKVVLELGGSDPFIVMPSADVEKAVETGVTARIQNNGQSCIAAKRFIVHADIYLDFARAFVARIAALKVGDPMDRATQVGPLASLQLRDELAAQVDATVAGGGTVLTGGEPIAGPGAFFQPTVLGFVPEDTPAFRDELFGPVATLFQARDIDAAIDLANRTRFGLGSSVWTNDVNEQRRFIDGIEAGFTAINGMVISDPRLPFGGVKASGLGRELSALGMREFLNAKTITRT
ncbi:MAG: NAD-dependent succinate-semialdehyde dehydrogenase [Hyphomonadaceae bacterium]